MTDKCKHGSGWACATCNEAIRNATRWRGAPPVPKPVPIK